MLDFSQLVDLPLVWAGLLAVAIVLYVLLDGFDLGVGILFPFAPSDQCRTTMMNSVAPFWDGNETWLVLGGGGLLAVFPLAYSVLMPAFYIPIIAMLLFLILRGVAFEFRPKAGNRSRIIWDICFHIGSLGAAFAQGVLLGAFLQGVDVNGREFAGGPFDWLTAFSLIVGVALVFGYALLGSTWTLMKTRGETQQWARRVANYVLAFVGFFMFVVSVSVANIDARIFNLWFSRPNVYYLAIVPLLTAIVFVMLWLALARDRQNLPFVLSVCVFILGFVGLTISIYPWMVPYTFTYTQAAASAESQSLLLIGTIFLLPIILCYTAYSYYVFWGKTPQESLY